VVGLMGGVYATMIFMMRPRGDRHIPIFKMILPERASLKAPSLP
jgi:hypothetical protein